MRFRKLKLYLIASSDDFPDPVIVEIIPVWYLDLRTKGRMDGFDSDLSERHIDVQNAGNSGSTGSARAENRGYMAGRGGSGI